MKLSASICLLSVASLASAITPISRPLQHYLAHKAHKKTPTHFVKSKYETHQIMTPVSHFEYDQYQPVNSSDTFALRYWYDDTYYKPGGPIICLLGGETDAQTRLAYLETGIVKILAEATNGVGVILEHRFYGDSVPGDDFSTDNLRFLTTEQAIGDIAHFINHFSPSQDVKTPLPAILYGGSYAGAQAALARKLIPDVVFGAISSSGVTAAIIDYWEYYEAIRLHSNCSSAIVNVVDFVDSILLSENSTNIQQLKNTFGLANVTHSDDFGNALSVPLGFFQEQNWDAKQSTEEWNYFCDALAAANGNLQNEFKAYAKWIRDNLAASCKTPDQDECFGSHEDEDASDGEDEDDGSGVGWRAWGYQVCTEWGFFQSAAPAGVPSMVSRLVDLAHVSKFCKVMFKPGKYNRIPDRPAVERINQHGGFDMEADRLAIIDGAYDPWLYATPHSPHARQREDTADKPFKVIPKGIHHWDENGLHNNSAEPKDIIKIHAEEVAFVKAWLSEWQKGLRVQT